MHCTIPHQHIQMGMTRHRVLAAPFLPYLPHGPMHSFPPFLNVALRMGPMAHCLPQLSSHMSTRNRYRSGTPASSGSPACRTTAKMVA